MHRSPHRSRGLIDARPLIRILNRYLDSQPEIPRTNEDYTLMGALQALAFRAGVSEAILYKLKNERKTMVSFDIADKIVCELGGPQLWYFDPELSEVYRSVDFTSLDERYPTVAREERVAA